MVDIAKLVSSNAVSKTSRGVFLPKTPVFLIKLNDYMENKVMNFLRWYLDVGKIQRVILIPMVLLLLLITSQNSMAIFNYSTYTFTGASVGYDVTRDTDGNTYVIGNTIDGDQEIWLGKYNAAMVLIASYTVNNPLGADNGYGIMVHPNGNIYCTGSAYNDQGKKCVWVGQFDPYLMYITSYTAMQGSGDSIGRGLCKNPSGEIIVTGEKIGTAKDVLLLRLNSETLGLLSQTGYSTSFDQVGYSVVSDNSGNLFISGSNISASTEDLAVFKFDSGLSYLKTETINGTSGMPDFAYDLKLVGTQLFIAGSVGNNANDEIFIGKWESTSLVFQSSVVVSGIGSYDERGYGIDTNNIDSIYIVGTATTSSGTDIFLGKYSYNLQLVSSMTYSSPGVFFDNGNKVCVDSITKDVYVIGNTNNSGLRLWLSKHIEDTSPSQITGLLAVTNSQVQLTWTTPGDNGFNGNVIGGKWQINYSSAQNVNPTGIGAYNLVISTDYVQGQTYSQVLTGLRPRTTYYFWIRAQDESSNWSVWSDTKSAITSSFVLSWTSAETEGACSVAWGDYDNDGDLDQLAGKNGYNRVYRNNGDGTFTNTWTSSENEQTQSVAWGDYDNDGDLDQLIGNVGQVKRIYRNNGTGTFTSVWTSAETGNTSSVAWGDYDNDGDLDQLVGNYSQNRIYRNNGDGTFTSIWISPESETTLSVAWGDYDNDGDLDQLVGNNGQNRIYRNDGNGTFTSVWTSAETENTTGIAWGDYDNDGDLDQLVGNYNQPNRVYRNNGDGMFTSVWTSAESESTNAIAWGDYDNDGKLDQVVVNENQPNRVYRNNGDGTFTSVWTSAEIGYTRGVAWGDYDNDGDLDQLVGNDGQTNRVYKSLEAEFGNTNSIPATPSTGFATQISTQNAQLELRWNYSTDSETTQQKGLYYNVRIATESITNSLSKWIVSPSTGAGTASFGNYPHGYVVAASTQPGLNLSNIREGVTYYWQVQSIDTGLRKSAWSVEQSTYVQHYTYTHVWDGDGADGFASNPQNWMYDIAPSTGDNIVFGSNNPTKSCTWDIPKSVNIGSMTITTDYLATVNISTNVTFNDTLTISSGTFVINTDSITIMSNMLYNGGAFDARTSTVCFYSTSTTTDHWMTLLDNTTFWSLEIWNKAERTMFCQNTKLYITGNFTKEGWISGLGGNGVFNTSNSTVTLRGDARNGYGTLDNTMTNSKWILDGVNRQYMYNGALNGVYDLEINKINGSTVTLSSGGLDVTNDLVTKYGVLEFNNSNNVRVQRNLTVTEPGYLNYGNGAISPYGNKDTVINLPVNQTLGSLYAYEKNSGYSVSLVNDITIMQSFTTGGNTDIRNRKVTVYGDLDLKSAASSGFSSDGSTVTVYGGVKSNPAAFNVLKFAGGSGYISSTQTANVLIISTGAVVYLSGAPSLLTVNNNSEIYGQFDIRNSTFTAYGPVSVHSGGILDLSNASYNGSVVKLASGITFEPGSKVVADSLMDRITSPAGEYYSFTVTAGTVNLMGLSIENLNSNGMMLNTGTYIANFSSVSFINLAPNARALNVMLAGTTQYTFSNCFFDTTVTTNVAVSSLSAPAYIKMLNASGAKAGIIYEYDPNNMVFWTVPSDPMNLSGTVTSSTSITWDWVDATEDEQGYKVYTSTSWLLTTLQVNANTWIENNLVPNTEYLRFVAAYNPIGVSSTAVVSKYTNAAQPTGLYVVSSSSFSTTLAWDANNPAGTMYEINYSTTSAFDGTGDKFTSWAVMTSTVVTNLVEFTNYYFQVRAKNGNEVNTGYSAYVSTLTLDGTIPAVVTLESPGDAQTVTNATVNFNWSNSIDTGSGVKYYELVIDDDSGFGSVNYSSSPIVSQADVLMTEGTYYWKVRAVDNNNNQSEWPAYNKVYINIAPAAVTDLSATPVYERKVNLTWTAPGDDGNVNTLSGKYRIDWDVNPNIGWNYNTFDVEITTSVSAGTLTNISIPDFTSNTSFYFRIWSQDDNGNWSELSNGATAYPVDLTTHVWDGGGATNNASEAANWVDDITPGNNDSVKFDTTNPNKACYWNMSNINISTITLDVGFSTTVVTMSSMTILGNFVVNAGTFTTSGVADYTHQVKGNFVQTGGYITLSRGKVLFTGTGAQTVQLQSGSQLSGFDINSSSSVQMMAPLKTYGNFNLISGEFIAGDFNHTIGGSSGNFTVTGGTLTACFSTMTFTGGQPYITLTPGTSFYHVVLNSGEWIFNSQFSANGNFTIINGSRHPTLGQLNSTIYIGGNFLINGGGFSFKGSTVTLKGNMGYINTSISGGSGQLIMAGNATQYVHGTAMTLTKDFVINSGNDVILQTDISVNSVLIQNGTLKPEDHTITLVLSQTGITTGYWLQTGGSFVAGTGSVIFKGGSSALGFVVTPLPGNPFYNMTVGTAGYLMKYVIADSTLTVSNRFTIANSTFNTGSYCHTVSTFIATRGNFIGVENTTFTVSNMLNLNNGDYATPRIWMHSATQGSRWNLYLVPGAGQLVRGVNVQDSQATGQTITATQSTNSGNNVNWSFSDDGIGIFTGDFTQPGGSLYDGGSIDAGYGIAVDTITADGPYVYVAGMRNNASKDWFVVKYNNTGVMLASSTYDFNGDDYAQGVKVNSAGEVYVTGYCDSNIVVAKYSSGLVFITSATFNVGSGAAVGYSLALDSNGNVFVSGYGSNDSDNDGCLLKYSPSLVFIASAAVATGSFLEDSLMDVKVNKQNNVFVSGYSGFMSDNCLFSYTNNLVFVSSTTISGGLSDFVPVESNNAGSSIFVAGQNQNSDLVLLKYDTSLVLQSSTTFDTGGVDSIAGMAVSPAGNVYLGGSTGVQGYENYFTVKYTQGLVKISSEVYVNNDGNNRAADLTVDSTGDAYLTGYFNSNITQNWDIRTLKFTMTDPVIVHSSHVWDGGGTTNNASEAENWTYDVVPTTGDAVLFDNTNNSKYCSWDIANVQLSSFTLGVGFSTTVVLAVPYASSFTVTNDFVINAGNLLARLGSSGTVNIRGNWIQTGGYVNLKSWINSGFAVNFDGNGTQNVTTLDNGSTFGSYLQVGENSTVTANGNLLMERINVMGTLDLGTGFVHSITYQDISGGGSVYGVLDIHNSTLTISGTARFGISGTLKMDNGNGLIRLEETTGISIYSSNGKIIADSQLDVITSTAPGQVYTGIVINMDQDSVVIAGASVTITGLTMNSAGLDFYNLYSSNVVFANNISFTNMPPSYMYNAGAFFTNLNGDFQFDSWAFDTTLSTNVEAGSIGASVGSVKMTNATGIKAGPNYELDPNNVVFWSTPSAAANLYAVTRGTGSIEWNWTDVSKDEKYYRLRKNTDELVMELPWNTTYYTENALNANTTYYRKVEAYNVLGTSVTSEIFGVTYARPPLNTYVSARTSYSVTIEWNTNDNPGYTRWGVIGSTDGFVTSTTTLAVFGNNLVNPQFVQIGLNSASTYYYKVQAFNENGVATSYD
ncbi:MAG: FG-GAP-like repeat-containing protein, partial [Elusimicrobiota bacterium]